jgi:nucleotide-binding universal stress UspA family protein
MFEKILYPTDFSDVSKKALEYIKQLKKSGGHTIVLLHVIDERHIQTVERFVSEHTRKLEREILKHVSAKMDTAENELEQSGFKVKSRIEVGIPVREILQVEEEEDVSVIVIGSHGKSNLQEMFLGSVSEKVVRKCNKPILIVKR